MRGRNALRRMTQDRPAFAPGADDGRLFTLSAPKSSNACFEILWSRPCLIDKVRGKKALGKKNFQILFGCRLVSSESSGSYCYQTICSRSVKLKIPQARRSGINRTHRLQGLPYMRGQDYPMHRPRNRWPDAKYAMPPSPSSVQPRSRLPQLDQLAVDFHGVRRLRPPPQVVLQVRQRRPEAFELLVYQPAVAQLLRRLGRHEQHPVHHRERLLELSALHVDILQVAQNPGDDLARGRGLQIAVELRLLRPPRGEHLLQALAQIGLGLRLPAGKRVEHELAAPDCELDEKMPGEGNALQVEAQALADFEIENGQRDRNPGAPLHDLVQIAVAGIVVVADVAREAHVVEQVVVQREHFLLGKSVARDALPDRRRDSVEPPEIGRYIDVWIDILGEHKARFGEIELVARNDFGEMLEHRIHSGRALTPRVG